MKWTRSTVRFSDVSWSDPASFSPSLSVWGQTKQSNTSVSDLSSPVEVQSHPPPARRVVWHLSFSSDWSIAFTDDQNERRHLCGLAYLKRNTTAHRVCVCVCAYVCDLCSATQASQETQLSDNAAMRLLMSSASKNGEVFPSEWADLYWELV